jgi:hypothetical protein
VHRDRIAEKMVLTLEIARKIVATAQQSPARTLNELPQRNSEGNSPNQRDSEKRNSDREV